MLREFKGGNCCASNTSSDAIDNEGNNLVKDGCQSSENTKYIWQLFFSPDFNMTITAVQCRHQSASQAPCMRTDKPLLLCMYNVGNYEIIIYSIWKKQHCI